MLLASILDLFSVINFKEFWFSSAISRWYFHRVQVYDHWISSHSLKEYHIFDICNDVILIIFKLRRHILQLFLSKGLLFDEHGHHGNIIACRSIILSWNTFHGDLIYILRGSQKSRRHFVAHFVIINLVPILCFSIFVAWFFISSKTSVIVRGDISHQHYLWINGPYWNFLMRSRPAWPATMIETVEVLFTSQMILPLVSVERFYLTCLGTIDAISPLWRCSLVDRFCLTTLS